MAVVIDPRLLRESATQLESILEKLDLINRAMQKSYSEIQACWQSELTPLYLDYHTEVKNKVASTIIKIKDIQNSLNNTATKAERAEREVKEILTDISKGDVAEVVPKTLKIADDFYGKNN